ncbi:MAG: N-acetyltransferase family protein [Halodesulfurarchaeum sp.]
MSGRSTSLLRAPHRFEDAAGRSIDIYRYGDGPVDDEYNALVEMYLDFAGECRAMGIPPHMEEDLVEWLDVVLEGLGVVAWDDDRAVGHALLLGNDDGHEVAIFVHQDFQHASIGTHLLRTLLGEAADSDIQRVWLTVESRNSVAKRLFRSVGFEITRGGQTELVMERSL